VSSMPPTCTHDLGPGITICLRCRQEQRDAARAQQQRLLAISGVVFMGLVGLYIMGASAASAWSASKDTAHVPVRASVVASSVSGSDVRQQGEATPAPAPAPATPTVLQPPFPLVVPEGRSNLPDSLIAERGGDSVIVDFDTPATRTRRRDKFETVVRRTLPMVYGAHIDSVLRTIPDGEIAGSADLLHELPQRGVHLRVAQGWTLDLWPETRPGQDGPLVVSYRARVTRDGALR
jgi:hypothetical protein